MKTFRDIQKRLLGSLYYDTADFESDAELYYKAIASNRLVFAKVKELKNSAVYKVCFIMEDGQIYSMHNLFHTLGYRINKKNEVYLPCDSKSALTNVITNISKFLFDNYLILLDEFDAIKDKEAISF